MATWIPEQENTHGKLQRIGVSWISGSISFQKELSADGTACLRWTWIKGPSTDLKERWTEDEKQRWTSWTNCPPSPSGYINFSELVWPHQVNYQVNHSRSLEAFRQNSAQIDETESTNQEFGDFRLNTVYSLREPASLSVESVHSFHSKRNTLQT